MAKKKSDGIPARAKLIIAKEEFRELLEKQITKGNELLDIEVKRLGLGQSSNYSYPPSHNSVVYDQGELEDFKDKKKEWIDYCLELLNQSFDIPQNEYYKDFENQIPYDNYFGSSDWVVDYKKEISKKIRNLESVLHRIELIPCSITMGYSENKNNSVQTMSTPNPKDIFVVYGHDEQMKLEIENFISIELKLNPVSLNSQPNSGQTIIEKFEKYASQVRFAIVLMSPDDETDVDGQIFKRARQNVILELGYFIAKLGRPNLCVVQKGNVEIPSDIAGILHIKYENNWKLELLKELKNAGVPV